MTYESLESGFGPRYPAPVEALLKLLNCLTSVACAITGLTRYAGSFLMALLLPKAALGARMAALQSQLAACRRHKPIEGSTDLVFIPVLGGLRAASVRNC